MTGIDKSGLDKLVELTSIEEVNSRLARQTNGTVVASPETVKLSDLEKFLPNKRRMQATMRTGELESFGVYCHEMRSGAEAETFMPVFVEADDMTATAIFDFGHVDNPLHGDNRAILAEKSTAAFRAFQKINGDRGSQQRFAEWLEDWRAHITMYGQDGGEMNFAACLQAIRKYEITEKNEAGSEVQQYSTKKTAMSSVAAKNVDNLPSFIGFSCKPYNDLSEREFMMRMSIVNGVDPEFCVRATHLEQDEEEMAQEFCDLVEARLNQGYSPEPGNKAPFSVFIGSV